jgi:hypothetical protein
MRKFALFFSWGHFMQLLKTWVFACALCFAATAGAQTDTLWVKRNVELRQSPDPASASLGPLAAKSMLTRMPARQGAWIQVKTTAGKTGWIHMFDASSSTAPSAAATATADTLRGFTNFLTGGGPSRSVSTNTATAGIRGLDAEDIANAQPNLGALSKTESLRQNAEQARQFAQDLSLTSRTVEPLTVPPDPLPTSSPGATGSNNKEGTQ